VGVDEAKPVTEDDKERENRFTGTIRKVTIEVKRASAVTPAGRVAGRGRRGPTQDGPDRARRVPGEQFSGSGRPSAGHGVL
jgi:hypothetical protein